MGQSIKKDGVHWTLTWQPKGWRGTINYSTEVLAYEKVTVPAGTFDAFKIKNYNNNRTEYYWYAPEVKSLVKFMRDHKKRGKRVTVLVEMRKP